MHITRPFCAKFFPPIRFLSRTKCPPSRASGRGWVRGASPPPHPQARLTNHGSKTEQTTTTTKTGCSGTRIDTTKPFYENQDLSARLIAAYYQIRITYFPLVTCYSHTTTFCCFARTMVSRVKADRAVCVPRRAYPNQRTTSKANCNKISGLVNLCATFQ